MSKSAGGNTFGAIVFMSLICGFLFLVQLTYDGCNRKIDTDSRKRREAAYEKQRQQELLLPPEERARLIAERERKFRQFKAKQAQDAKELAEYEKALELVNSHDVK